MANKPFDDQHINAVLPFLAKYDEAVKAAKHATTEALVLVEVGGCPAGHPARIAIEEARDRMYGAVSSASIVRLMVDPDNKNGVVK